MIRKPIQTGTQFGKLTVLGLGERRGARSRITYSCACSCGNKTDILGDLLRAGITRSCGCLRNLPNRRHGHAGYAGKYACSPTYAIWTDMKKRCLNKNHKYYKHYGARGIQVCARWQKFDNFLEDMGERPSGLTLDRINVNGNYEPGNCRWASRVEQQRNKQNTKLYTWCGTSLTLQGWLDVSRVVNYPAAYYRLQRGWSLENAITVPAVKGRNQYA